MKKPLLVLVIFIFQVSTVLSQMSSLEKDLLVWFDNKNNLTGTSLINGIEVTETILAYKDSHKYYKSPYFVSGTLHYQNQEYYNVLMMYDIFEDNIIVKFNEGKRSSIIQLLSNEVKSFSLHDTQFERLQFNDKSGFFELIETFNSFKLYKEHSKYTVTKTNTGKSVRHEFVKANEDFIIKYNDMYAVIDTKRDLYNMFPNIESEIKSLFNKDKKMQLAWRNKEMKYVFKQIENLLAN
ncbi:hypothetical protein [Pontimicrobium aquaticum]|uniref:Uncharacterized protein n=1 Tax=Pontimicrobium aquaticum TaxID=2565367 RepID=A0A4U0EPA4_9FLAO|nr:hypothetical protein [Pontimicrobium aquaticum]TJY33463.1 hypothetical protein E5167_13265 [Pontimicrobium aquaticum]